MALSGPVIDVMATEEKARSLAYHVASSILAEVDKVLRQAIVKDELEAIKSKSPTLWDLIPTEDDSIQFSGLFLSELHSALQDVAWDEFEVGGFEIFDNYNPFIGDRFEDEIDED